VSFFKQCYYKFLLILSPCFRDSTRNEILRGLVSLYLRAEDQCYALSQEDILTDKTTILVAETL
jgi:hypothetical protein